MDNYNTCLALHQRSLMLADFAIYVGFICSICFSIIHIDVIAIFVFLVLFPYLYFTGRRKSIKFLLISSVQAIAYFYFARTLYQYNRAMILINGYTVYPLFAWAIGLFGGYLIYSHWAARTPSQSLRIRFWVFASIYWLLLLFGETITYRFFNFHNIAAASYSGFPILNCIHGPSWVKAAYVVNGPIYFLLCEAAGLSDPSHGVLDAPFDLGASSITGLDS
jgi:hypothetical protein